MNTRQEREREQELTSSWGQQWQEREKGGHSYRHWRERKGENCNIGMIFCEIWGEMKGVARITLQTLWATMPPPRPITQHLSLNDSHHVKWDPFTTPFVTPTMIRGVKGKKKLVVCHRCMVFLHIENDRT